MLSPKQPVIIRMNIQAGGEPHPPNCACLVSHQSLRAAALWMEVSDWFGRTLLSFTSKQPQEGSGFSLNSLEISTNGT
ncbi:hypothetical protein MHYP_G00062330 [Metynnis hypsauchen]